ncbi:hypothetical protein D9M69_622480 [compost metagenome]
MRLPASCDSRRSSLRSSPWIETWIAFWPPAPSGMPTMVRVMPAMPASRSRISGLSCAVESLRARRSVSRTETSALLRPEALPELMVA